MHSESSSAYAGRSVAARADVISADSRTAAPSWDVRVTRYVDDTRGQRLLERLLAYGVHGEVLARPVVTRSAPAVSAPWLRSLHSVRVPIKVHLARTTADGYVDVMQVGAGATEVVICLSRTGRWSAFGKRRRLERVANDIGDQLHV